MPQVTVYIREDDLDQWKAIEKKSEFIHDALIMAKLPPAVTGMVTEPLKPLINADIHTVQKQPQVINKLPTAMPTTLEEANDPKSPGYSAKISPDIIKTPQDAKKAVEKFTGPITKQYSSRKKGSKERHIDL